MNKPVFVVEDVLHPSFPRYHDFKEVRDSDYWVLPETKPEGVIVLKCWCQMAQMDIDIYQCKDEATARKVKAIYKDDVQKTYEFYMKS